jgi:hypothetical protein
LPYSCATLLIWGQGLKLKIKFYIWCTDLQWKIWKVFSN